MPAPEIAVAYVSIVPSLNNFTRDLRRQVVGPAGDAGDDAGEAMGGRLKGALKAGAAAAAVAAGAVIVSGLTEAIEQSGITKTLRAQLGASGKDAARYGKVAGKLYSEGVTNTFQEGADVIRSIMNAGLLPPDASIKQIQRLGTKMQDVSSTFGTDMNRQTEAVSSLFKNKLSPSASDALDVITVGMQKLGPNAEDLLDTFQEYPPHLRKLGIDAHESLGLFSQGLKNGARDTDIVADALKEFAIRAVDAGDTGAAESFKALGLNAKQMRLDIGKGGDSAQKALQAVLDKLRNIKDPVKRNTIAIGLFGTQAEDMGKSLYKLDPSKANKSADALGKVSGSAGKLGKTLRSGPIFEIKRFTRTLKQQLVNVLGKYVIPAIGDFIDFLPKIASGAKAAFGWVQEYGPWFVPLAIAIGGVTLALNAQAIAVAAVTAVFSIYRAAMLVGTAVTGGFAAVQATLNAVMALNPFVLVAIALAALVALVVVAWQKSDTFRRVVIGAWEGIKTAALYAWENVLRPVFTKIGEIATWLYQNIIKPVFAGIMIVWKVWWFAARTYFAFVRTAIKVAAGVVKWLYFNVFKPVFSAIMKVIKIWWGGVKVYFSAVRGAFRKVADVAKWLYSNIIKPVFGWIADKAKWLWKVGVKPSFDALKHGVSLVAKGFSKAKDAISKAWGKVKEIAAKPVRFIVNTVYNGGIVPTWNKIAKAFGAPTLKKAPKFATGGILPGYTPGRDPHQFYSPTGGSLALSGGEAIMRPEFTRAVGPGFVNRMNLAARSGGVSGVRAAMGGAGGQAFKNGGIFGWVSKASDLATGAGSKAWDLAKKGASWLKDGVKASARAGLNAVVKPLIRRISGSPSLYKDMVTRIPKKIISSILSFSGKADKKLTAAGVIGGGGFKAAQRWAKTQNGKRYQWGGNGNPSWDCSGYMSAIESVIRGQRPHRRWATGAFPPGTSGWKRNAKSPFMIGITNAGVGHTAGTINGVNVESRGGGVHYGGSARGYKNGMFTSRWGYKGPVKHDLGGWLMPGDTMVRNQTRKPEPVLNPAQWRSMATLAQRGAESPSGGLQPGDRIILSVDGRREFEAFIDRRADNRIDTTLTAPAALGRRI
ncbi:phage tail tape measure protein [Streptomyces sp. NPDC007063]|uniref:phage tail tape measure protein n=1 Tax=Streptomyces sp. NPDC007063 TaxID=3364772 RepID=UPI003679B224